MNVKNMWMGAGRITKDLELRVTESGYKVVNFDVAIDDGTKEKPHTTYLPLEAWGNLAETIQKHFHKGDQIICAGRNVVRKTVDRGENRYQMKIIVESFEWGAKKKETKPVNNFTADDVNDFVSDDDFPWAG